VARQRLGTAIVHRDPAVGLRHLQLATESLARLHRADESNAERRLDLVRAHRDLGRVLLTKGAVTQAVEEEHKALALLAPAASAGADDRRRRILQGEVWIALGEALSAAARTGEARAVWEQAASTLTPMAAESRDPRVLAPLAHALLRLGRREEARPALERLRTSGYRRWDFDRVLRRQVAG